MVFDPLTSKNFHLYKELRSKLDRAFRDYSLSILENSGVLALASMGRWRTETVKYWIKYPDENPINDNCDSLARFEQILASNRNGHPGHVWKFHLPGQQHDYYFYISTSPEECLDLLDVSMVMAS